MACEYYDEVVHGYEEPYHSVKVPPAEQLFSQAVDLQNWLAENGSGYYNYEIQGDRLVFFFSDSNTSVLFKLHFV